MKKYTTVNVRQLERKGKPWQARAKYKDQSGKWKEISKMLPEAKGKREAQRMANEWLDELNAAADIMPKTDKLITVEEAFHEVYKYRLDMGIIEKTSYTTSVTGFRRYIKPYIGDYIFTSLDKTAINNWLTKLYARGLSQSIIRTNFVRLKSVYSYYYDSGELLEHPFRGIKPPKRGASRITHLTDQQMDDVLEIVYTQYKPKDRMYAGILLAFYAGLRRSEICGLRWRDIDFHKHTLTVRTAIGESDLPGYKSYAKNPKNRTSFRTFPMVLQLEKALWERHEAIKPDGSWYVIGKEDKYMIPREFSRRFHNFAERNDLRDVYGNLLIPHGLRHNLATVGIRSGMDIASLSLMMGHASRAMTLDTYGDANADALELAAVKLRDKFNDSTQYFEVEEEAEA